MSKLIRIFVFAFAIMLISTATMAAQEDKFLCGFSQAHNGHPWRVDQTADVRDYWAANLTDEMDMIFTDGRNRPDKQTADVEDLMARGIDCLIITPVQAEALTPVVERAMEAGIIVITLDREVNSPVTLHIGADNELIGQAAASYIGEELLDGEGQVIEIQGTLGASATIDRNEDFMDVLTADFASVEVIASQTGDYERSKALTYMEDMIQRFGAGEFQVVYAHNDEMALGAIEALKAADRLEGVWVVGIDGQNEAFDAIAAGEMTATFTYPNGGAEGVEYAYKILTGEEFPELEEGVLVLPTELIDSNNVEDWIDRGF
jgi:ribose transport system substrate-binding protein